MTPAEAIALRDNLARVVVGRNLPSSLEQGSNDGGFRSEQNKQQLRDQLTSAALMVYHRDIAEKALQDESPILPGSDEELHALVDGRDLLVLLDWDEVIEIVGQMMNPIAAMFLRSDWEDGSLYGVVLFVRLPHPNEKRIVTGILPLHSKDKNAAAFIELLRFARQHIVVPHQVLAPMATRTKNGKKRVASAPPQTVGIVTLRAAVATIPPPEQDTEPFTTSTNTEAESREWSCRWKVRSHVRRQWYPSRKCHEYIVVNGYEKGPDDKPLREQVAVVSR